MTVTQAQMSPFWRRLSRISSRVLLYVLVTLGGLLFAIPFIWMVRTSIMPASQVYRFPPEWIPEKIEFGHYVEAFKPGYQYSYLDWLRNSFVIASLGALGAVVSSSIVGFSFARMRFPGRELLFVGVLATMILPAHVRLVPTYLLFTWLGWVGSYRPLIVPLYFAPPFFVFLMRQFYMTIPKEMDDAAYIDGCNPLGLFLRIYLPLSLPALGVVLIFQFTGLWNQFLQPLLYIKKIGEFPIAVGLRVFQGQYRETRIQALMAASLVSLTPVLALFFVAQRYFVQGIVITGVKG